MLLDGVNHVAILTADTDRLHAFYRDVFEASVSRDAMEGEGMPPPSGRSRPFGTAS